MKSYTLIILALLTWSSFDLSAQDWEDITTPVSSSLILYGISFPAGQDMIGYVGGSSLTYNGKGKILKTENLGTDWAVIYENEDSGSGITAVKFLDTENGWAGRQDGMLMQTADGGATWTLSDIDPNNNQGEISDIEFYDVNNGAIVTAWGGIFYTHDGGVNWNPATTNPPGIAYQIAFADANNLFAVGNQQTIFHSADGGLTWAISFVGPSPFYISLGINFRDEMHGLVTSEEGNIFTTEDGGQTWTPHTVINQFGLMRGALIASQTDMYVTGTPGSVYKSTDGGITWDLDSPFDPDPSYYNIIMTANGTLFVTGSGSEGGTILRKLPGVAPMLATSQITHLLCFEDSSGAISLSVSGGTPPYTYLWSNDETTVNVTGLSAGFYDCTITDANGDVFVLEDMEVTEPDDLLIFLTVTDESAIGAMDGAIDAILTGGTGPFQFSWEGGVTTEDLVGVSGGIYCVTVTDGNGCEKSECAEVLTPPLATLDLEEVILFNMYPNPIDESGNINLMVEFEFEIDLAIQVITPDGLLIYESFEGGMRKLEKQINIRDYPSGIYMIRIMDLSTNQSRTGKILKLN